MSTRTALLNGNVINRDTDFSKYIEAVSEPWVISWFTVTSSSVAIWKAFVPCERTNGDIIYAVVYNTSAQSISWDGDVYIEISQELIDNWELTEEDWTWIAEIKVWTMPAKNALKLATITSGVVTDKRNMIKKVGELLEMINDNAEDISDLDDRIEELEEAWAINHLEERELVGELYTANNFMFKQYTPNIDDCDIEANIWDTQSNTAVHIQRLWSWVASNTLKLKVKSVWSPTTWLVVQVRKWVQVTVTANSEAYWYWGTIVASWSIAYSDISWTWAEKTITLDSNFWWTEWELLDVVVYQTWAIVNASNYYCIACDNTQWSQGFRYLSLNWTLVTKSNLMPYCISSWFWDTMLVKEWSETSIWTKDTVRGAWSASGTQWEPKTLVSYIEQTATYSWDYTVSATFDVSQNSGDWVDVLAYVDGTTVYSEHIIGFSSWSNTLVRLIRLHNIKKWQVIQVKYCWLYTNAYRFTTISATSATVSVPVILKKTWIPKWKPRAVESIWSYWYITTYWMHIDDIYYWWIMIWTSSSATTWSITLWNAVWYITVNLNGETLKIPYYW